MTCINFGLGFLVAVAMHLIGMPNALLWGVMVALFNYVPYVGAGSERKRSADRRLPHLSTTSATSSSCRSSDFTLETIEGHFITPILTGRSLTLNPVMIFVSMLLWAGSGARSVRSWRAAPDDAQIFCDHITSLDAIGEFVTASDEGRRRHVAAAARPRPDRLVGA